MGISKCSVALSDLTMDSKMLMEIQPWGRFLDCKREAELDIALPEMAVSQPT